MQGVALASTTTSDPKQQAWTRLRQFQGRAHRVLDTNIARRADLATLGSTMKVIHRVGKTTSTIVREHPPMEDIEQAATRFRPISLNEDNVYYAKVVGSLGLLTKDSALEAKELHKRLRKAWLDWNKAKTWSIQAGKVGDPTDQMPNMWDRDIAHNWLYGYLVHDDAEAQHRIRYVPETDQIFAALLWLKDGILLTAATHRAIKDLESAGELH